MLTAIYADPYENVISAQLKRERLRMPRRYLGFCRTRPQHRETDYQSERDRQHFLIIESGSGCPCAGLVARNLQWLRLETQPIWAPSLDARYLTVAIFKIMKQFCWFERIGV